MTIHLPEPDFLDRFLKLLGKKRGVKIPAETYEKFGPYVYAKAQKESFWSALIRPKGKGPPPGYVYLDELYLNIRDNSKGEY